MAGHQHHPPYGDMVKAYLQVGTALFVLTILTVVASWDWIPASWGEAGNFLHITIGLIIAIVKAAMVVWIFMHFKFDKPFIRVFVYVPVFLFFVLNLALNALGGP